MAPSCYPGGSNSRGTPLPEKDGLTFMAMCCFIQDLFGLTYCIENPAYSDIFKSSESPLH
eukprot:5396311-Prorocentrum_lima.AAC.1